MTTKERIYAEIEQVGEDNLDELYGVIKSFVASKAAQPKPPGIMSKLKAVKIEAPEDFAANLDLYASGEKRAEENLH
jgi:hypothetical protein